MTAKTKNVKPDKFLLQIAANLIGEMNCRNWIESVVATECAFAVETRHFSSRVRLNHQQMLDLITATSDSDLLPSRFTSRFHKSGLRANQSGLNDGVSLSPLFTSAPFQRSKFVSSLRHWQNNQQIINNCRLVLVEWVYTATVKTTSDNLHVCAWSRFLQTEFMRVFFVFFEVREFGACVKKVRFLPFSNTVRERSKKELFWRSKERFSTPECEIECPI